MHFRVQPDGAQGNYLEALLGEGLKTFGFDGDRILAGLERVYGVHVKQFLPFDDQAQRATALDEGVIDVAVTFTTDGQLATGRLVLLQDDRHLQPTDLVTPMVSARALSRYGAPLRNALNAVSAALDTRSLIFLNWRVGVAGEDIRAEARGWLNRHAILAAG